MAGVSRARAFVRLALEKRQLGPGAVGYINAGGQINNLGRADIIFGRDTRLDVTRDPKLDELIEATSKSPDIAEYKARMGAVARYVRENHIVGPLVELGAVLATSPKVPAWQFTTTPYGWDLLNLITSLGVIVQAVGVLFFLWNVVWSLRHGERAGDDPWDAWTLEWSTSSPPPAYNFEEEPVVYSRRPLWDRKHPADPDWRYE